MTIQLEIPPEIQEILNYERYHHPVPLVQRRMEVLWLKSHGLPHHQIATLAGITENTVRDYFQLYLEGGVERLKEVTLYHPRASWMPISRPWKATSGRIHPLRSRKRKPRSRP